MGVGLAAVLFSGPWLVGAGSRGNYSWDNRCKIHEEKPIESISLNKKSNNEIKGSMSNVGAEQI